MTTPIFLQQALHPDIVAFMAKYGLRLQEGHNLKPPSQFNLVNLKFRSFLEEGDGDYITDEEMRQRAVKMNGNLGLADAKNLVDQLNSYPNKHKDLQDNYIVLPDTLLLDLNNNPHVACLCLYGSWCLIFVWRHFGWGGDDRFACSE